LFVALNIFLLKWIPTITLLTPKILLITLSTTQIPNYRFQNESSKQQGPHNIPNYRFPPNFITSSSNPNYRSYYGSMMPYSSEAPPYYSSTPMGNQNVPNVGLDEFPEFSTQMALGDSWIFPNVGHDRWQHTPF